MNECSFGKKVFLHDYASSEPPNLMWHVGTIHPTRTWDQLWCKLVFFVLYLSFTFSPLWWHFCIYGPIQIHRVLESVPSCSVILHQRTSKLHFKAQTDSPSTHICSSWSALVFFCTAEQSHSRFFRKCISILTYLSLEQQIK